MAVMHHPGCKIAFDIPIEDRDVLMHCSAAMCFVDGAGGFEVQEFPEAWRQQAVGLYRRRVDPFYGWSQEQVAEHMALRDAPRTNFAPAVAKAEFKPNHHAQVQAGFDRRPVLAWADTNTGRQEWWMSRGEARSLGYLGDGQWQGGCCPLI